jgi:hypothetical protein
MDKTWLNHSKGSAVVVPDGKVAVTTGIYTGQVIKLEEWLSLAKPVELHGPIEKEEKPDTLLPNSCDGCGASYVDYGDMACTEDICKYDRRDANRAYIESLFELRISIPKVETRPKPLHPSLSSPELLAEPDAESPPSCSICRIFCSKKHSTK